MFPTGVIVIRVKKSETGLVMLKFAYDPVCSTIWNYRNVRKLVSSHVLLLFYVEVKEIF